MAGKIVTVLGEIAPSALGRTLTHEHVSMQFEVCFVPPVQEEKHLSDVNWSLEASGWIRQNPYGHNDNLVLNDVEAEQAVISSLSEFKRAGGGCIVENSTTGLHRKTAFLKRLSHETGVHVVAGTGYYVVASQDKDTLKLTSEAMAAMMTTELTVGCLDDASVKAGIVGEIGCTYPMHDFERRAIVAAAEVQQQQKCAVSFHPGRHCKQPFEIMRIFQEAGGRADKTIMSHLERTIQENEALAEFASLGAYCQFDLFGVENSYYSLAKHIDYPSDAQRMDLICHLLKEGFEDKVLIAQDIHTKHRLEKYGGHGYSHILKNVVPKLTEVKGVTQAQMDKILIANPAKVLTIN